MLVLTLTLKIRSDRASTLRHTQIVQARMTAVLIGSLLIMFFTGRADGVACGSGQRQRSGCKDRARSQQQTPSSRHGSCKYCPKTGCIDERRRIGCLVRSVFPRPSSRLSAYFNASTSASVTPPSDPSHSTFLVHQLFISKSNLCLAIPG